MDAVALGRSPEQVVFRGRSGCPTQERTTTGPPAGSVANFPRGEAGIFDFHSRKARLLSDITPYVTLSLDQ